MQVKYIQNKKHQIITMVLVLFLIFNNYCETEIIHDYKHESEPVVYCLINPYDSVHYLKLTRTFSGGNDARKIAKIADSLYYKNANVYLEIWSGKGWAYYRSQFEKITDIKKESGYFNSSDNVVYKLVDDIRENFGRQNIKLNLTIDIPSENKIASAVINIYRPIRIIKPKVIFFSYYYD